MNKLMIIGNLVRDPETRTLQSGDTVVTFTVAVNRRGANERTDYVRVTTWQKLAENCARYLAKGKKVCVVGPVRAYAYTRNDGGSAASLEMTANEVEFLSSASAPAEPDDHGFTEVDDEECPF